MSSRCYRRTTRRRSLPLCLSLALMMTIGTADPPGSGCDPKIQNQMKTSSSFQTCSALTGLILGGRLKKKDDLDPTRVKFCRSSACLDVFRELESLGGLYCLGSYSTSVLALDTVAGGVTCFGADAFSPPTSASALSSSPPRTQQPADTPPATTPVTMTSLPTDAIPVPTSTTPHPTDENVISTTSPPDTKSNPSDGSLTTAPVTARVERDHHDQAKASAPATDITHPDVSTKLSTTSSIVLWLLAVTSSFMAVVFGFACFVFYRRSKDPPEELQENSGYVKHAKSTREQRAASKTASLTTGSESPTTTASPSHKIAISSFNSLEMIDCDDEIILSCRIPYEKLVFEEQLSHGSFGEVYRGTYRGETVAIKTLLPAHRKNLIQIKNLLHEVKLLATLEHERIVQFIGVAWDSWNELSVVMEFSEGGDLRTFLKEYESSGVHAQGFDAHKVKIALHIAHGLMYLHTLQPIVLHRDLKSRNVLLDSNLNAKITDFGVSRECDDATMTAGVGSCLWMAPEVVMGDRYNEKADIFSFGVLLSELDLHSLPYSHARTSQSDGRRLPDTILVQMVSMGLLSVAFTDEEQSEIAQLGRDCVCLEPSTRPRASEVLHRLHQIHGSFLSTAHGAFV